MYPEELEKLIKYALIDGNVLPKEREILIRKAVEAGIDKDEFEMVLDARIYEANENHQSSEKPAAEAISKKPNKCPNCQANIDASSTTCGYCGFDVVNRESNASIQHLFKLLML